jgi:hypothetical protein
MTTHTCPTWCTYLHADHAGDHWHSGSYTAATRSTPIDVDQAGAILPAVGAHLAKWRDGGTDVVLHIGASGENDGMDEEIRLSLTDAIEHAANLLATIRKGLNGQSSGVGRTALILLQDHAAAILDAHENKENDRPAEDEEAAAAAIRQMSADVASVTALPIPPGFFATQEQKDAYERATLEADLPDSPTYGVVSWTVANGPNKGREQSMFGTWAKAIDRQSDDPLARPTLLRCSHTGQDVSIASIQSWTKALVVPMQAVDDVLHAVPADDRRGGQAVTHLNSAALDLSRKFLLADLGNKSGMQAGATNEHF